MNDPARTVTVPSVSRRFFRTCPICGGSSDELGIVVDYGVPALGKRISVSFAACEACLFAFQQNPVSDDQMTLYYKSSPRYRCERVEDVEASLYARQFAFMEQSGSVRGVSALDIGADMGKLLDVLHAQGCQTAFMESNEKAVAYLNSHGRHRWIERLSPEDKFEVIILSQVYEHIAEPVGYLRNLRSHLAPAGRIFIEVPCHTNWDRTEYGFSFEHVNYFSTFALTRALHNAGYFASQMEIASDARYFDGRIKIIRTMVRPYSSEAARDLVSAVKSHHAVDMSGRIAAARQLALQYRSNGSGGLALYGAAELADMVLSDVDPHETGIVAIFDTDAQKHGRSFHGFSIMSPSEIPGTRCGGILILSAATTSIRRTIKDVGFAGAIFGWSDLEDIS